MVNEPSEKRGFLFLHTNAYNATSRHSRSKSLDSRVRHHLMVDIGKSRRKPPKDPQFVTSVWSLAEGSETQSSTRSGEGSSSRDDGHSQASTKGLVAPDPTESYTSRYAMPPILYTLSVFEKEWGEDWFSAYGFTLILAAGKNAMASARQLRSLALDRSLITIQCVESRIASSNIGIATSDDVINAVLALVCYNFTSLDFDQAMTHVKGMGMVIAARGGISTLDVNQDLMLMISWVDITAALLHDTKPLFPLYVQMAGASVFHCSGLDTLPAPLLSVIDDENSQDMRFTSVMSCMGDLNALAILLQVELATRGDAIWDDEEQISFLINPVTHQLLDQQPVRSSGPTTRCELLSEALRLGAIIWIIRVKQKCHSYPGAARTRISTLLEILSSNLNMEDVWNTSPDIQTVRFWLLVLCSISEPSDQDCAISMRLIASDMKKRRLISWDDIMSDIRQMPWIDVYELQCAELGQRLMEDYLRTSISATLSVRHH
ncbi:hypothetical protein FSARC_11799 [Fusarium sarcochroum]|uniref:Uncharacterized protein n=1 Tax=Fusarium sarcochroum TaxID=1208366 RepID=A0A8H4WZP2_9HYPO|nr:hypothetical protein FSARC_11799 [Fusarium sarcochroum]